jgi:tetratricopeptide (TPR) repeat protein
VNGIKRSLFIVFALILAAAGFAQSASIVEQYKAAKQAQFDEDYFGAVEGYLTVLKQNPAYLDPMRGLAECYYQLDEYDEALRWALQAEKYGKGELDLVNLEAYIRIGLQDTARADTLFRSVLDREPNNLDARFGLAELDLAKGRTRAALEKFRDTLAFSPDNRRALLSLALLSRAAGNDAAARGYIEQALRLHGDNPYVHYFAAYLATLQKDFDTAEKEAKVSLGLKPGFDEARGLLGSVLYEKNRFQDVVDLEKARIRTNRKNKGAWFTVGLAQFRLGRIDDGIYSLQTAVSLDPEDETARAALEMVVNVTKPMEDPVRSPLADFHFAKARDYEARNMSGEALFEYRRGIRAYPYSRDGRLEYAALLKRAGLYSRYLSELNFLKSIGKTDRKVDDEIENYSSLMQDRLPGLWKVNQFNLDKPLYSIAVFYVPGADNVTHVAGDEILTEYLADVCVHYGRLKALPGPYEASSFAAAFRTARTEGADYFLILHADENERDVQLTADMYVGRTGADAARFTAFRTGNERIKKAVKQIADQVYAALPLRATLLARKSAQVLIDAGATDGVKPDTKLVLVKKGGLVVKSDGVGLVYGDADVLGTVTISATDEEIASGTIERNDFFDRINPGDELTLLDAKKPPQKSEAVVYPGILEVIRRIQ